MTSALTTLRIVPREPGIRQEACIANTRAATLVCVGKRSASPSSTIDISGSSVSVAIFRIAVKASPSTTPSSSCRNRHGPLPGRACECRRTNSLHFDERRESYKTPRTRLHEHIVRSAGSLIGRPPPPSTAPQRFHRQVPFALVDHRVDETVMA